MLTATIVSIALPIIAFLVFALAGLGYFAWLSAAIIILIEWEAAGTGDSALFATACVFTAVLAVIFGIPAIRRTLVSGALLKAVGKTMPQIGETEDIALKAGTVFFEGSIFSGAPKWREMLDFKVKKLSKAEKAYLAGPVEELCKSINDDDIAQTREFPKEFWDLIKKHKFFGLEMPKKHGGLGFSSAAHSAIVTKISSRSLPAAVTVMVPNSLGPAELIHRYGTKAQKDHYLEKLANAEEIPCFALTEPTAGSDAANGQSVGIVCKGKFEGKDVLGMKLTFNKRYITLAPVATVVGLAFRLYDPEKLLGDKEDIGITCALIPHTTKGLDIGNRHDPAGVPFPNGPVRGTDVFVPLDFIIGGKKGAGLGWKMLMECLSTGRAISLPSLSVGAAEVSTRTTTAYASVREQFGLPVAKFEGVRERLLRIATSTYYMEATKSYTVGAVDAGESPAVSSAICKAYLTEDMRVAINDGMDVMAGSAICRGPKNIFTRHYAAIPIGITVEGANILTRSLITFGQGAIRCHPFVLPQVEAIAEGDVTKFDKAFFGHINHTVKNASRSFKYGLVGSKFIPVPSGDMSKHFKKLTHLSTSFAFMADMGLATLGGGLKKAEYLSGRYADALAWLYMGSSAIKRYHDDKKPSQKAITDYCVTLALHNAEEALMDIADNLPSKFVRGFCKFIVFPTGLSYKKPTDKMGERVLRTLLDDDSGLRDSLTRDIFIPSGKEEGFGMLEEAFKQTVETENERKIVLNAVRAGKIKKAPMLVMIEEAKKEGIITKEVHKRLKAAEKLRDEVVQVADYTPAQYKKQR